MKNLVVVSYPVCAHIGHKNLGDAGAPYLGRGCVADPLDTRFSPTFVIAPNLVAIGQTV